MKKIIISFLILFLFVLTLFSQITIQYSVHSLKAGDNNPMSYCSYVDPGESGANIVWNFSELKFEKPFTGFVLNSQFSDNQYLFPKANTVLGEFDARFYFDVNQNETDQYGFISSDGKSKEIYSVPFVKMKYPFSYGEAYSGVVAGTFEYSGNIKADMAGTYTVEADAYGTLILPNNTKFENVLRVKTSKSYRILFPNSVQELSISTYRWYNAFHRYPLLVLTEYTTKTGNSIRVDHQAAYNSDAIDFKASDPFPVTLEGISIFPNPVRTLLMLRAESLNTGSLNFEIHDLTGKEVRIFERQISEVGTCEFDLSSEIIELKPASYILIVSDGSSRKSLDFTIIK
jgi:hypothetical protein